jgi:hypothetical protein
MSTGLGISRSTRVCVFRIKNVHEIVMTRRLMYGPTLESVFLLQWHPLLASLAFDLFGLNYLGSIIKLQERFSNFLRPRHYEGQCSC